MATVNVIGALYEATNQNGRKSFQINNVVVYGRIRCAIEPVDYLASLNIQSGFFVLIDVLGLECKGIDHFPDEGSGSIKKSHGTLVAICDEPELIGEYVRVFQRNGRGCNIRFGLRNGKPDERIKTVNCMKFAKSSSGAWVVEPNLIKPFGTGEDYQSLTEHLLLVDASQAKYKEDGNEREYHGVPTVLPKKVGPADAVPELGSEKLLGRVESEGESVWQESMENGIKAPEKGTAKEETTVSSELVHRLEARPVFDALSTFEEESERTKTALSEYRQKVNERVDKEQDNILWRRNSIIMGFYRSYISKWSNQIPGTRLRCNNIVKDLAENLIRKSGLRTDYEMSMEEYGRDFYQEKMNIQSVDDRYTLALGILDTILGTSLYQDIKKRVENEETFYKTETRILLSSPYDYALIRGLSVEEADKLFFLMFSCFGGEEWLSIKDATERRDTLIVNDILTDQSNPSSLVEGSDVFRSGIPASQKLKLAISQSGTPFAGLELPKFNYLVEGIKASIRSGDYTQVVDFINIGDRVHEPDSTAIADVVSNLTYSGLNWMKDSHTIRTVSNTDLAKKLDEEGIAVQVGSELVSTTYLNMEEFVYKSTHALGVKESGVTDEVIEAAISEYEEEKGFKLEELQKDGVKLVKWSGGVLSGQAGSGKTTVSEVFVKALKKGLPNYEIKFAAPTGKAAMRMKEVLGDLGDVRTIHSLFELGIEAPTLFSSTERVKPVGERTVYILDEMAMCTVPLLYQVMSRLSPNSMIFFLGDIKQLPPIGKGMPFRDMLNYMPSVELGVSKRAKDGSGINSNCDIINQRSTDEAFENLQEYEDFRLVGCNDKDIVKTILAGVKNNVNNGKFDPNTIQVATPYATPKKPYSSANLNPQLQDIFLPDAPVLFTHAETRTFKKGARAIHVRKNIYTKKRYVFDPENQELVQAQSKGIVNGEVGYVVGVFRASEVNIVEDTDYDNRVEDDEGIELETDKVESSKINSTLYVLLELDDPDIDKKVVVLYHARDAGVGYDEWNGLSLKGSDLSNLELAYALTVHKLQGSQAKMIIIPMSSRDNSQFVNRNMLYTAVSRAQEMVVLIGSVNGDNSMLNASRRNTKIDVSRNVMSILAETKEIN